MWPQFGHIGHYDGSSLQLLCTVEPSHSIPLRGQEAHVHATDLEFQH